MSKIYKLIFSIILVIFIIASLLINLFKIESYNQRLRVKDDLIINYIANKDNIKKDDILNIYYDNRIYDDYSLTNDLLITNFSIVFIYIILISLLLIYKHYKSKKEIDAINSYIDKILNDDYSIDIRDHKENMYSYLKSYLYKVLIKLKEQKQISVNSKLSLEKALSDISHQLKTPITSMYVVNDILYSDIDNNKKKYFLDQNKNQLDRIEWLISSLLKLSMLDSGTIKFNLVKTSLRKVVEKAVEPFLLMLEVKKIKLDIVGDKNICNEIDLNWTVEALSNIIKNSYEHTNEGGYIKIEINSNNIYNFITITDNGCGIKKEDINHIFERFYKSKLNKNGVGIGLNLSKNIILKESGDIKVSSREGVGTSFIIRFYNIDRV